LKLGASKGIESSQLNLGALYANGWGVKKNPTMAANWFRKAMEQNNHAARFNLGVMQYHGLGLAKNKTEAIKLISKAALDGHGGAAKWLGKKRIRVIIPGKPQVRRVKGQQYIYIEGKGYRPLDQD
jgi:TPR repeat protein